MRVRLAVPILCALLIPGAYAAEQGDKQLIDLCVNELKARQPPEEVQGNTQLVDSSVQRLERQIEVRVQVTEAEGRSLTGRCIIRNGKVFDFREK
jgi:hypothetical protein